MSEMNREQVQKAVDRMFPYVEYSALAEMDSMHKAAFFRALGRGAGAILANTGAKGLARKAIRAGRNTQNRFDSTWAGRAMNAVSNSAAGQFTKGMIGAVGHGAGKANIDWGVAEGMKLLGRMTGARRASIMKDGVRYDRAGAFVNDRASKNIGDYIWRAGDGLESTTRQLTGGRMADSAAAALRDKGHNFLAGTVDFTHKAAPVAMVGATMAAPAVYMAGQLMDANAAANVDMNQEWRPDEDPSAYLDQGAGAPGVMTRAGEFLMNNDPAPLAAWHPIALPFMGIQKAYEWGKNKLTNYVMDQADAASQQAINAMIDNRWKLAGGLAFAPEATREQLNQMASRMLMEQRLAHLVPESDEWNKVLEQYQQTYGY